MSTRGTGRRHIIRDTSKIGSQIKRRHNHPSAHPRAFLILFFLDGYLSLNFTIRSKAIILCFKVIFYVKFSIYTAAFYVWSSAYTAALHHPKSPAALYKYPLDIKGVIRYFTAAQVYIHNVSELIMLVCICIIFLMIVIFLRIRKNIKIKDDRSPIPVFMSLVIGEGCNHDTTKSGERAEPPVPE